MGAFGPGPSTEFRCGSCWHSHFSWRGHIWKMLPRCLKTHSKTPIMLVFFKIQFLKKVPADQEGPGPGPGPTGSGGARAHGPMWAHGPIWAHMGPYGPNMGPYGPTWVPYGSIWGHMGPRARALPDPAGPGPGPS